MGAGHQEARMGKHLKLKQNIRYQFTLLIHAILDEKCG